MKSSLKPQKPKLWQQWISYLATGIIPAFLVAIPAEAAERIYFNFGPLGFSVKVDSLETFAKEGTVTRDLNFYLSRVTPEVRSQFRQALQNPQDVDAVQLYRFFRTSIGEEILTQAGNMINIQGGGNGKYALRAALFHAANEPGGLTLLNFLRKFPTNIYLDTDRIFDLVNLIDNIIEATDLMVVQMEKLSSIQASNESPIDFSSVPDIRFPGKLAYTQQTIILKDETRKREFKVELYKPQELKPGKTPVVVASHGLASTPQNFEKLAKHLASYGYLVAAPQHPGSDFNQLQEMLEGYSQDIFKLNEFIDRPLDIIYLLDELERRNQTEFGGRLNLQEVGLLGHSFGGYAALSLAGAQIDFTQLEKICDRIIWDPNLSLLIQCQAAELPRKTYNFRDPRVKAVMAINPLTSTIFGAKGLSEIKIPVALIGGSEDVATPILLEQIRSFTWLNTPDKYLIIEEGQAHIDISQLDAGASMLLKSLPNLKLAEPHLLDGYGNAVALAFFGLYVEQNQDYRQYLQSSYAKYITEKPFNLYLLSASSGEELNNELLDLRNKIRFLNH
jgi:predicted dienelactone hydrolase